MYRLFYVIIHPPFIDITCPVVYLSSINQSTHLATSVVSPIFPNGISSFISSNSSFVNLEFIFVYIIPGAIEFTLIFEGPSSFANAFVKPSTPAFDTE